MPLFKRVDQLPAATGVTGTDYLILSRPSGPTGTVGTRAVTLSQILALATGGGGSGGDGPTGPTGARGADGAAGAQGSQGPTGAASTVTGPTGAAGAAGSNGEAGSAGATGPTGPSLSGSAAGGDLTGTYPNPTIAPGAVVTADIADGAVTFAKTTGIQKIITSGTDAPTGGSSGDIYLRYSP